MGTNLPVAATTLSKAERKEFSKHFVKGREKIILLVIA
jgi:hypothetical protein